MDLDKLIAQLILHEGSRLKPYKCTAGKWTIGVGHNLDANWISSEILNEWLVENDFYSLSLFIEEYPEHEQKVLFVLLQEVGISKEIEKKLLLEDIQIVWDEAEQVFGKAFIKYSDARQRAILDMIFNLGLGRFLKFKKTVQAIKDQDWDEAAKEAQDSSWFRQVGSRAKTVTDLLQKG